MVHKQNTMGKLTTTSIKVPPRYDRAPTVRIAFINLLTTREVPPDLYIQSIAMASIRNRWTDTALVMLDARTCVLMVQADATPKMPPKNLNR